MSAEPTVHVDKVAFENTDKPDRGYSVRASYLKEPHKGDALIEIFKDGSPIRRFLFPAYKVWNIAAHFPARGLAICAASGGGWDHVSVSRPDRCPTWDEMQWVRETFFRPDECVMQIHPPMDDHVSHHPYCLHLWRPHAGEIPRPPKWMIA